MEWMNQETLRRNEKDVCWNFINMPIMLYFQNFYFWKLNAHWQNHVFDFFQDISLKQLKIQMISCFKLSLSQSKNKLSITLKFQNFLFKTLIPNYIRVCFFQINNSRLILSVCEKYVQIVVMLKNLFYLEIFLLSVNLIQNSQRRFWSLV